MLDIQSSHLGPRSTGVPRVSEIGIVALVAHRWNGPWMTPHHLLTRLAEFFHVVWVEPAVEWRNALLGRMPSRVSTAKLPAGFRIQWPERWLPGVYRPHHLALLTLAGRLHRAVHHLRVAGCKRIVLYVWHPRFVEAISARNWDATLYQLDDDYALMGSEDGNTADPATLEMEGRLFETVDRVIAISPGLVEKARAAGRDAVLIPEGVDFSAYSTPQSEPKELIGVPRPRVGYAGMLKRQLDWELIAHLAHDLHDHSFIFVGPEHHPEVRNRLEPLEKLPNVHVLGRKPVTALPSYMQAFDVCTMPYAISGYTNCIYPLKLHEYLATGRPVVATPIRSLLEFSEVVTLASGADSWRAEIARSLSADSAEARHQRQDVARSHDWSLLIPQVARVVCDAALPERAIELDSSHDRGLESSSHHRAGGRPVRTRGLRKLLSSLHDEVFIGTWARRERRADHAGLPATDPGRDRVIEEGVAWLVTAQACSSSRDGGVARDFSLIRGWAASYPETTGYIVTTMLAHAAATGDSSSRACARRMLDWLVSIQFPEGGFQGGCVDQEPAVPVCFNTGQILLGLSAGCREFGAYGEPMRRAADWLTSSLDADGSWQRYPSPFAKPGPKAYETHTAWGLLEAARLVPESPYADAALANIRWALSHQRQNGWVAQCCLDDPERPLSHTLGYFLRGVLEGYRYSKDPVLLAAARRTAEGLREALRNDGFLPGRLNSDWSPAVNWACLTGSSQIAHCWLTLFDHTGDARFRDAGYRANEFVRRTIVVDGPDEIRGAVKGAFPVDGDYVPYSYPNWATKFTIDANMLEREIRQRLGGPREPVGLALKGLMTLDGRR